MRIRPSRAGGRSPASTSGEAGHDHGRWRRTAAASAAALVAALLLPAAAHDDPGAWQYVTTVPDSPPAGVELYAAEPGVVYVLAQRDTDAVLYRWDGAWTEALVIPDTTARVLYGLAADDIWVSASTTDTAPSTLHHFDGTTWTDESAGLPVGRIRAMAGVTGDLQIGLDAYHTVYRDTGAGWTLAYTMQHTVAPRIMATIDPGEAYLASCWGHGWWSPTDGWTSKSEFDFCDVAEMWGTRDAAGDLHLYIAGTTNFRSNVRIWDYDEATRSFGSKYGSGFTDGPHGGAATSVWGSGPDDVWAAGYVYEGYYEGPTAGRIYHNDGTGWTTVTAMGPIEGRIWEVSGTGPNDVWFLLEDGRLLHYYPNDPPVADADGPYLAAVSQPFGVDGSGSFDPDGDDLTYTWTLDTQVATGVTATLTAPTEPGIHTITLTVSDGAEANSDETTVVVYDPDAGFVTGGGWIASPLGAYASDPALTGEASFGFVSRYKKGASTPQGNTVFEFSAGALEFHSTSYDWLVVTGSDHAMFKGTGTIDDAGSYRFMVWAGDDDPDTFRIRIWNEDGGTETVVYDNGSAQPIGNGSIVVHTGGKKR